MKGIALLGSTGSIGVSTLDVVSQFPEHFNVVAMAAGRNLERLTEQARRFRPKLLSIAEPKMLPELRERLGPLAQEMTLLAGPEGPDAVAAHPDAQLVITAMVGAIGLRPTLVAIERGIEVGIANKEPLVAAGKLCTSTARRTGATLLPIDSEHNAIFQCLSGQRREDLQRLILTCSGGPFREVMDLGAVTREQALKHPTWSMGPKITIDSATLMNKGLEVIEASWLFDVDASKVDIIIHPQSVVHSMIELRDGSILAQLGTPDMRVPIGYALGYPARLPLDIPKLDLSSLAQLSFEAPDRQRFPAVDLAYRAARQGGTYPAALNAANEVAVAAFLDGKLRYVQIAEVITAVLDMHEPASAGSLDEIIDADQRARVSAQDVIARLS
jgi:1-deoxy-D-xylulose-5-phosphate reductoisomerase